MSGSEPRVSAEMLRSTSTPNTVESRLGTLKFTDGAPTKAVRDKDMIARTRHERY